MCPYQHIVSRPKIPKVFPHPQSLHHNTYYIKFKFQSEDAKEVHCGCLSISTLGRDIEDLTNPLGSKEEQCFQVDSELVFNNENVNGKKVI